MDTPTNILGNPVAAVALLSAWPGEVGRAVIVSQQPDGEHYNVHYIACGPDGWDQPYSGSYDLDWSQALAELADRASVREPDLTSVTAR